MRNVRDPWEKYVREVIMELMDDGLSPLEISRQSCKFFNRRTVQQWQQFLWINWKTDHRSSPKETGTVRSRTPTQREEEIGFRKSPKRTMTDQIVYCFEGFYASDYQEWSSCAYTQYSHSIQIERGSQCRVLLAYCTRKELQGVDYRDNFYRSNGYASSS